MKFKKALAKKVKTIENKPISITKDIGRPEDPDWSKYNENRKSKKGKRIRVYTPLTEEQMNLYELDPEHYEDLEDSGIAKWMFD